jgi:hypothetical protein
MAEAGRPHSRIIVARPGGKAVITFAGYGATALSAASRGIMLHLKLRK